MADIIMVAMTIDYKNKNYVQDWSMGTTMRIMMMGTNIGTMVVSTSKYYNSVYNFGKYGGGGHRGYNIKKNLELVMV